MLFPDGQYKLPVVAISAAGDDQREVQLTFERQSRTKGEVGKVKQPAHLKAPPPRDASRDDICGRWRSAELFSETKRRKEFCQCHKVT